MRQHRDRESDPGRGEHDVSADRAGVTTLRDAAPVRHQSAEHRQERGDDDGRNDERAPHRGRRAREGPRHHQGQKGGGCRQRATQVVQHLPAPDHRNSAPKNPRKQLPVAPRPPVLARHRDTVVRWRALEQLDVGHQTGTHEHTLEEIVAQQRVLGYPPRQRRLEGVDVVDALAGV